jgi:hypothetical protein
VNTVIVLLAPPDDRREDGLSKTARFVMFKKPFEEVARAEVFKAIEAVTDRQSTEVYRVTARLQRELLEEGLESETDEAEQTTPRKRKSRAPLIKTARYIGNKWGGKYLRAPDIFFMILEKGKGKLVRLGDIAEVRFGIKTGANDFFYLEPTGKPAPAGYLHVRNGAGWEGEIEEEFLKPILKSAKDSDTILIDPAKLRTRLFLCHASKAELSGTRALEYIRWGESKAFDKKPSVQGRRCWYDVGHKEPADAIVLRRIGERMPVFEANGVLEDCVLFGISRLYSSLNLHAFLAALNATWTRLYIELMTRQLTGAQAVADTNVYLVKEVPIFDFRLISGSTLEDFLRAYRQMRVRPCVSIFTEKDAPDRRALDEAVFDVLGLTAGEREAVYEAVVNLVRARLEKARSV